MRKIELLSPARTVEHGIEAINHGADAVYIGAPRFSARTAAGNTVEEIESLVSYAHQYFAKIYVALNTILDDRELQEAEQIIHKLYNVGVDALIVQDFGITQLNLPPIPLHASTQMDNRTVEKVRFLENLGFEQVVLARELTLDQIAAISSQTNVKLEAFIHGALCVSYSGQCYLSQALCGRSANRGACAQMCRLPYTLKDANGDVLVRNKHLLSLKDMNMSGSLRAMIDAGVSSLKIEGRLKDLSYVKNVTAFYRQKLDEILEGNESFRKASSGKCTYTFVPNLEKSFHRGSTSYFLHGRLEDITSFDTPKSLGETIGKVLSARNGNLTVDTDKQLSNGDGFCFMGKENCFEGFKANRVDGNVIFPSEKMQIPAGSILYRNFDQQFEKQLSRKTADRKVLINLTLQNTQEGFCLIAVDEDNIECRLNFASDKVVAENKERQSENIKSNLSKIGNSIYEVASFNINTDDIYFIPSAKLTQWKREMLDALDLQRSIVRKEAEKNRVLVNPDTEVSFPRTVLDYSANVHNEKAKQFYRQHGVQEIADSFEKKMPNNVSLMTCKHCIKYALGMCAKNNRTNLKAKEPLMLVTDKGQELKLFFDCAHCEMQIRME